MTEKIKEFINDPVKLEKLYREDKKSFESGFRNIYSEIEKTEMAKFWKIRLDFDKTPSKAKENYGTEILVLISVCLLTGFLIKIPDIFKINLIEFPFYEKNAGIIVFLGLTIYAFSVNRNISRKNIVITMLIFLVSIIYINLLPGFRQSASINLVYIHMPILMWCVYGLVFIDFEFKNYGKRIRYISHYGDLAIMGALILISGGLLTGITYGLFMAIGINIERFYSHYIILVGLVSAPIVTTFILKNSALVTNKIAPIIANIFSPLVLITLIIYLTAIAISGKDPYNNRDFLLIFNMMLIGVMGIIIFSVSETSVYGKQRFSEMVLFILSIVALIVNLIALSAIFYRLGEYGLTPNRLAILGSNILIFINLILIMVDLYKINFMKADLEKVELTVAKYLPLYIVWIIIVIFGFPLIFGMR